VHGVFEDSLPDDWGRKLLIRKFRLTRAEQRVPHLLKVQGLHGMGALKYTAESATLPVTGDTQGHDLEKVLELALRFEQNNMLEDEELAVLFQAGSSPGGARPKALVSNKGIPSIAKFPSIKDQFDVVGLEAAAMSLAKMAGLKVAETQLIKCGKRKVLLVDRFDVAKKGGRLHMISMQTLLGADGYYNLGYSDLAEIIRQVSGHPSENLENLYRQMVFNAMIGNTDDHLKNFLMLHGEAGWQLSPAFDLVPNIGRNQEHVLHINNDFLPPDRSRLLAEAKKFGFNRRKKANEIIDEEKDTLKNWRQVFEAHQVPERDSEIIGADIVKRLNRF
jgi:serine/threonine-protein kinase HipA